tara:strand:+ start:10068 stop:11168 length:1101 start_codon:yes stop_codon:yes gene_type:complete
MKGRRQFFKIILGFFATVFTIKYSRILNAMNTLPYHHLPDGTFRNLPGSFKREITKQRTFHTKRFFRILYKGLVKREMFDQKEVPDTIPKEHFIMEDAALSQLINNKDEISITWLGHASFLIKLGNQNILTDPYLSKTAGPFGIGPNRYIPPAIQVSNLPPINSILISHNHYDHLDTKTLLKIKNKRDITVICPLKLSKIIYNLGYKNVIELDWYERKKIFNLEIFAMPAYHWSRRLGQKYNSTLWNGYVLNYESKKIYFSGDTAFGNMFTEIGNKYGPFDLTIVPIGAYMPREMMKASHCTPEEAVEITTMLNSKNILGMHWGTIRLSAEDPWEPPKRFKKFAQLKGYSESQIWQLSIGQTKSLI